MNSPQSHRLPVGSAAKPSTTAAMPNTNHPAMLLSVLKEVINVRFAILDFGFWERKTNKVRLSCTGKDRFRLFYRETDGLLCKKDKGRQATNA